MAVLIETLEVIRQKDGLLFDALGPSDLARLNELLVRHALPRMPRGYVAFLSQSDGMCWNGIYLHGAVRRRLAPSGYHMPGLVEAAKDAAECGLPSGWLLLGAGDDDIYVYNGMKDTYHIADMTDHMPISSFNDFADLLACIIDERI
ncbi:MAG: YrhA family protein [Pseudomonadota bacterium]|nr:YrhA family protein [Pseudomonadota bacterium]